MAHLKSHILQTQSNFRNTTMCLSSDWLKLWSCDDSGHRVTRLFAWVPE